MGADNRTGAAMMRQMADEATPPAATPHVFRAINQVMAAISATGISKARKNEQQGYKFRGIDDVYNALSPLIADAELVILPRVVSRSVTERVSAKGNALFYVVVEVEYDFVSAVDGSRALGRSIGEAMDSADKATNKAMSAAFKYLCMQAFCIPTEGDNDADRTTHDVQPFTPPPDAQPPQHAAASLADSWVSRLMDAYDAQDFDALANGWNALKVDKPLAQMVWRRLPIDVHEKITDLTAPRPL